MGLKWSKIAIVLGLITIAAATWMDIEFIQFIRVHGDKLSGDLSPSFAASALTALSMIVGGFFTLIFSLIGLFRKERFRYWGLLAALLSILLSIAPMAYIILAV